MLWTAVQAAALAPAAVPGTDARYRRWRGRDGLGLGDIKLAAVAGAWLSLVTFFATIEFAALSALGAYILNATLRKRPLEGDRVPAVQGCSLRRRSGSAGWSRRC